MSDEPNGLRTELTLALEEAVRNGLVSVERHASDPAKDHYTLTEKGKQYVTDLTNHQKYEEAP